MTKYMEDTKVLHHSTPRLC